MTKKSAPASTLCARGSSVADVAGEFVRVGGGDVAEVEVRPRFTVADHDELHDPSARMRWIASARMSVPFCLTMRETTPNSGTSCPLRQPHLRLKIVFAGGLAYSRCGGDNVCGDKGVLAGFHSS